MPACTKEIKDSRQNSSFWNFIHYFNNDCDGFIHTSTEKSDLCLLFPEGEHKSRTKNFDIRSEHSSVIVTVADS